MKSPSSWDWDIIQARWDSDPEANLVGFPCYLPVEVELKILLLANPDDTYAMEMVCRFWFYLVRGPEFRVTKLTSICQQRIDNFPGYQVIPKFLEGKGWRYLIASKRTVTPGDEDSALKLATIVYEINSMTIYEGFWCMGSAEGLIRGTRETSQAGGFDTLSGRHAVPNGLGIMYHKNHDLGDRAHALIISGAWCQGALAHGRVSRDGGILMIINKYAGAGLFDGCYYCEDGSRFEGLFHLRFPISYTAEVLSCFATNPPRNFLQACLGQYFEPDESKGLYINRLTPQIQQGLREQSERDRAQRAINDIQDPVSRLQARRDHERELEAAQDARIAKERRNAAASAQTFRQRQENLDNAQAQRQRQEALDDIERRIDEISDEEEREQVRRLHRGMMANAEDEEAEEDDEIDMEEPPPLMQMEIDADPVFVPTVPGRRGVVLPAQRNITTNEVAEALASLLHVHDANTQTRGRRRKKGDRGKKK